MVDLKSKLYINHYLQAETVFDSITQAECILDILDCLGDKERISQQDQDSLLDFFIDEFEFFCGQFCKHYRIIKEIKLCNI